MVNQTRLPALAAVPTAPFALEVQRGEMPGAPGGMVKRSVMIDLACVRATPACAPSSASKTTLEEMQGAKAAKRLHWHLGHALKDYRTLWTDPAAKAPAAPADPGTRPLPRIPEPGVLQGHPALVA